MRIVTRKTRIYAAICAGVVALPGCNRHTTITPPFAASQPHIISDVDYNDDALIHDANVYFCALGQTPPHYNPPSRNSATQKKNTARAYDAPAQNPQVACNALNATFSAKPDLDAAKAARNSMAYGIMADIRQNYEKFKAQFFYLKGATAVGFDFAQLGLTAATTIATHAATKTIFGALATGISGLNLSYDTNFFSKQTYAVIAMAMDTHFQTLYNGIVQHLDNDDVNKYPWTAVWQDLYELYGSCSVASGLQELQREAGAASQAVASKQSASGISPTTWDYGLITVNQPSASHDFSLSNKGTAALSISPYAFSGPNPGDFKVEHATCSTTLAPAASCTYTVVFTPADSGARSATLTVNDNEGSFPVSLTGKGTWTSISKTALAFGTVTEDSSSLALEVTNTSKTQPTKKLEAKMGTDAPDFAVAPGPSPTGCGSSLAAGASCSYKVTFRPKTIAPESATLSITDDEGTFSVKLTGTRSNPR